ncbi:MAG: hypothetical protein V7745_00565 [Pseudomonadales bacterium]
MIPFPTDYDDFDPYSSSSSNRIEYEVETSPQTYLNYAIDDIENEKTSRTLVNSFSNAKRALHLQVETLANAFGFKAATNKKRPNFHDYIAYCKNCGVVTPRILKKLNKVRNAVEHEYYTPNESETEDFIDVVELFLAATDRFIFQFPLDYEFLPGEKLKDNIPDICSIELKPFSDKITLVVYSKDKHDENIEDVKSYKKRESIEILAGESMYFTWLSFMVEKVYKS